MKVPESELERYLHDHIPLSRDMGIRVERVDGDGARLTAPLAPNVNHRRTAFGGSVGSLAILSAWTLIHARLREAGLSSRLVVQRSSVEYLHPIRGDFEAWCRSPDPESWERFRETLSRRGRARIVLRSEVRDSGRVAATFQGSFVAQAPPASER